MLRVSFAAGGRLAQRGAGSSGTLVNTPKTPRPRGRGVRTSVTRDKARFGRLVSWSSGLNPRTATGMTDPVAPESHVTGTDPLSHGKGPDPRATRILYLLAEKAWRTGQRKYNQAVPVLVKEVVLEDEERLKRQRQRQVGSFGTTYPIAYPPSEPSDEIDTTPVEPGIAGKVALPPRRRALRGPLHRK